MKIGVIGSGTASQELPAHLAVFASADIEPRIVNPRLSVFALTPYERLIVDVGYVDAAQSAAAADCDALFVNSMADYGLEAMRAAVPIPVVGAGEAALREAASGGRRFAIVTVWPRSMGFLYDERLRACGLTGQCVAIHHLTGEDELVRLAAEDGVMARMHRGEHAVIAQLAALCAGAVQRDGAECLVLGCTCMAPIGPALAAACTVPVIEASRAGFLAAVEVLRDPSRRQAASAALRSRRTTLVPGLVDGWFAAARGRPAAPSPAAPPVDGSDCPVCIADPR
ncbi:MAG: aspartate/glutamate racemase family protein [Steroidobacteraceae bacterium]|nr:aspartate/glutamate racemase family protein [Nevskiaceae bacterium]MCP5338872.1 aspartate/glutamate racemase family protein [Nevskiaceae bacterium]MCP5360739.1 aspartate/glutamate racemase family protein [Nevskiaceae bacterium]MCP5466213.1 aspartate/glutamate racemase family protein [Nevskiaceae bacterium]